MSNDTESAETNHVVRVGGGMIAAAVIGTVVIAGVRQSLSPVEMAGSVLIMAILPFLAMMVWAAYSGTQAVRKYE